MSEDGGSAHAQIALDRSVPIAVQVYEILRDDIVTLRRPPGSRLSDKEISADLSVSRTPVREAVLRLAEEGLAEAFPNSGTFVTKIQARALRNAHFVRRALECASIRDAAARITPEQLAELHAIVAKQEEHLHGRPEAFYRLDERFHRRLFEIADHKEAWPLAVKAKAQLDRVRYLAVSREGRLPLTVLEHRHVVEALANGDGEEAAKRLAEHLDAAYLGLERTVRIFCQYFASEPAADDAPQGTVRDRSRAKRSKKAV